MAQTVALQRGTTTVSGNNGSATLFTQSGGTATRVILNNLSFYSATPCYSGMYITLGLVQSGGQSSIIGQIRDAQTGALGRYSTQFFTTGNNQAQGMQFQSQGITGTFFNSQTLLTGSTSNTDIGATNQSSTFLAVPLTSNYQKFSFCPQNFYMGPSDSLIVKTSWYNISGKSVVYATVNTSYSFTTITES